MFIGAYPTCSTNFKRGKVCDYQRRGRNYPLPADKCKQKRCKDVVTVKIQPKSTMQQNPHSYSIVQADAVVAERLLENQGLDWADDFFDEQEGIIAVFDFDYQELASFNTKIRWVLECCFSIYLILVVGLEVLFFDDAFVVLPWLALTVLLYPLLSLIPCFLSDRMKWEAECHHLAITRDDILYVQEKHKQCCGWSMCDQGKVSRIIPLDHTTECTIKEPAGNSCLCFRRSLYEVHVHTISSAQLQNPLVLSGLREPYKFQSLVSSLKRASSRRDVPTIHELQSEHLGKVDTVPSGIELV